MATTHRDDLHELSADELRQQARERGISGVWDMTKDQLVDALTGGSGGKTGPPSGSGGGEPIGESKAVRYSRAVTSTDEHEERPGRSLVTRDHDVIRRWAEGRGAQPATVPGTEHGDHLGVLRFDFPGYGGGDLEHVSWDEWFRTFDERRLNFVYQEHRADGSDSNFFRLDNPDREDG